MVALVWAQRQPAPLLASAAVGAPGGGMQSEGGVAPPVVRSLSAERGGGAALGARLLPGVGGWEEPPPIWASIRLRIVGLCNLLGLVFQLGVGLATALSRSNKTAEDGIMLEILALNHFGLFAQGVATGAADMTLFVVTIVLPTRHDLRPPSD